MEAIAKVIDVRCSCLVQFGADSSNNFIMVERCISDVAEEVAADKNIGSPPKPPPSKME